MPTISLLTMLLIIKCCAQIKLVIDWFADDYLNSFKCNNQVMSSSQLTTQILEIDSQPGDELRFEVINTGQKGGISALLTMGDEKYSTEDYKNWITEPEIINPWIIRRVNDGLYGDTSNFKCDVFIAYEDWNPYTFIFVFPYKSTCVDYFTVINPGNTALINFADLVLPKVQGAEIDKKWYVIIDKLPEHGLVTLSENDEQINLGEEYPLNKIWYTPKTNSVIDTIKFRGFSITNDASDNVGVITIGICNHQCFACEADSNTIEWFNRCTKCIDDYAFIYDNEKAYITCIELHTEPADYYLDANDNMYKYCDNTCRKCSDGSDEDLIHKKDCFNDYPNDSYYLNSDEDEYFICNTLYVPTSNECVQTCPSWYPLQHNNWCVSSCPENTIPDETQTKCINKDEDENALQDVYDKIKEEILDIVGQNPNYDSDNSTITIYDYNETSSWPSNESRIYLGECERILVKHYKLSESDQLIIVKLEIPRNNSYTNQVEYAVYDQNGNKLDWTWCKEAEIVISYPIVNEEGLNIDLGKNMSNIGVDIYNSNDPFFNDICYSYSVNGTDVVITDRRDNLYINVSFCEENCVYQSLNYDTMTVNCVCNVKEEISTTETNQANVSPFEAAITTSNIKIVKCYWVFTKWANWQFNIGFWFSLAIIICVTFNVVSFYRIGLSKLLAWLNQFPKTGWEMGNPPVKNRSKMILEEVLQGDIDDSGGKEGNRSEYKNQNQNQNEAEIRDEIGEENEDEDNFEEIDEDVEEGGNVNTIWNINQNIRNNAENEFIIGKNKEHSSILFGKDLNNRNIIEDNNTGNQDFILACSDSSAFSPRHHTNQISNYIANESISFNSLNTNIYNESWIMKDNVNVNVNVNANSNATDQQNDEDSAYENKEYVDKLGYNCGKSNNNVRKSTLSPKTSIIKSVYTFVSKKNSYFSDTSHKDTFKDQIVLNVNKPIYNSGHFNQSSKNECVSYSGRSIISDKSVNSNKTFNCNKEISCLENSNKCFIFQNNHSPLHSTKRGTRKELPELDKKCSIKLPKYQLSPDKKWRWNKQQPHNPFVIFWFIFWEKQKLLRNFYHKSMFEWISIKLLVYLFAVLVSFTLNAMFYTDDIISERYHNNGSISFMSTILKSIYSWIAGLVVTSVIRKISWYHISLDTLVLEVKDRNLFQRLWNRFLKGVKRKIIIWIIIVYLLLLFFWYYLTIFCCIFNSSQWSWFIGGMVKLCNWNCCFFFDMCYYMHLKNLWLNLQIVEIV